jgi:glycosyltransferase involved in cell wall biosynthesis
MDRRVPTRVTYWTGTWAPEREAISKEIQTLRSLAPDRPLVVSLSPAQRSAVDIRNRVLQLSSRHSALLRAMAPLLERRGDVTHVFGGLGSWHLLRSVGCRPTILTIVLQDVSADPNVYGSIGTFVAETDGLAEDLRSRGVPPERIRIIPPGVDLHSYRPLSPAPSKPFRVLFASTPSDPAELEPRGITPLVEAARLCPDMEFVFLWRTWGDQDAARRALGDLRPPPNVVIERRDGRDMPAIYQASHAISCLYAPGFGKSCPNSVVEALACGLPALVSDGCGIAPAIAKGHAGLVSARDPRAIAEAARALRDRHGAFSRAARALATEAFGIGPFLDAYADLYRTVARSGWRPQHGRPSISDPRRDAA